MDVYEIFADLKPGVSDVAFADALGAWLGRLRDEGRIESWRLLRRKLGLGPAHFGEFQILIETRDLAQLDAAFHAAATRAGDVERLHVGVNALVTNFQAALYRDFPDPMRKRGGELF